MYKTTHAVEHIGSTTLDISMQIINLYNHLQNLGTTLQHLGQTSQGLSVKVHKLPHGEPHPRTRNILCTNQ
jgi:hypothetical protein